MVNYDAFLASIKSGVMELAKTEAGGFIEEAKTDANAYLDKMKVDLEKWTKQLVDGDLSREEFEFLLGSKKDLLEMKALADVGLAKQRVENIVNGTLDIIVKAASSLM